MPINPEISLGVKAPTLPPGPVESMGQVLQLKHLVDSSRMNQEQLRGAQLANQAHETALAGQKAMSDLMSQNTTQGPDGKLVTNHGAVIMGLTKAGHASEAFKYDADRRANETEALKTTQTQIEIADKNIKSMASALMAVKNAPETAKQSTWDAQRNFLITAGKAKAEDIPPTYDPQFVETHIANALDAKAQIDEHRSAAEFAQRVLNEAPVTAEKWNTAVFNRASAANNQQELDFVKRNMEAQGAPKSALDQLPQVWSPEAKKQMEELALTTEQRKNLAGQAETRAETKLRDANTAKNQEEHLKISKGELDVSRRREAFNEKTMAGITDQNTLQMMANAVRSGVPMSQVVRGQGKSATATAQQVLGLVAKDDPTFNIGKALADYKGEAGAVVEMTKTHAQMKALENVSGKNMDYALEAYSKLPDTGSKLLNMPIRLITDKMLGSGPQAEALTALMGASRETARMVNNFGGKGELTDTARRSVDKLANNENMTLNELIGTFKALKTDMRNVSTGYGEGLDEARSKIGPKSSSTPSTGTTANPTAPKNPFRK
jgi:hypothetical protein